MSRLKRVLFAGDYKKRGDFRYCQWIEGAIFCHKAIATNLKIPYCPTHRKRSLNPKKFGFYPRW